MQIQRRRERKKSTRSLAYEKTRLPLPIIPTAD